MTVENLLWLVVQVKPIPISIKACLTEQKIQAHEAVIVGDTKFDMIGGKKTGVRRLGVTWGFGSLESLKEHGAESICYQPEDLKKALSSL